MSESPTAQQTYDHDVVIVGGGPAGCSAGVFTGREGLDTAIFDRGRSSLKRCAYLENYLGFPDGVDIETFYRLIHDHAETAGCEIVPDVVESVDKRQAGPGFNITPTDGEPVTARRVIAATRYHQGYLDTIDGESPLETTGHGIDPAFAANDGTTPVDGLYIASLGEEMNLQAIIAAGRGARVGGRVVADARMYDGWWEATATRNDWTQRQAELDEEFDREPMFDWFDEIYAEDAPVDSDSKRYRRVRELCYENGLNSRITREEIEARTAAGHRTIASHLDVDAIVDAVDETALLDALDEETVREYVEDTDEIPTTNN